MQKKKPPFQVIPNCGVSGPTNWNESKEVAAEQDRNASAGAISPAVAGLSVPSMAIAELSRRYRSRSRIPASSQQNGAAQ
jgi:hypothetical protein